MVGFRSRGRVAVDGAAIVRPDRGSGFENRRRPTFGLPFTPGSDVGGRISQQRGFRDSGQIKGPLFFSLCWRRPWHLRLFDGRWDPARLGELADGVEELLSRPFVFERTVIPTRKRNGPRPGDEAGEVMPRRNGDAFLVL